MEDGPRTCLETRAREFDSKTPVSGTLRLTVLRPTGSSRRCPTMRKKQDATSFGFTKSGFKIDSFDDFLPNGRSLRLIAQEMWPGSTDVQVDFITHPYPLELPLSAIARLRFAREFNVCRWLDVLESIALGMSANRASRKKTKAADALIELLRVIDWRYERRKEFHLELAEASAHLLELGTGGRNRKATRGRHLRSMAAPTEPSPT